MIDVNTQQAKQMFLEYACNIFFMAHDGVYEEYKSFGISQEQETDWRREFVSFWVERLSTDDFTAVNQLSNARAFEALPELMQVADTGDDYARLWYANAIYQLASGVSVASAMQAQATDMALGLWQTLTQRPIEISDAHKVQILPNMKWLEASTPEEYVRNYARRNLENAGHVHREMDFH